MFKLLKTARLSDKYECLWQGKIRSLDDLREVVGPGTLVKDCSLMRGEAEKLIDYMKKHDVQEAARNEEAAAVP